MSDRTVPTLRRGDGRGLIMESMIQQASQKFDPDILVAMDKRDNSLIEDEIVHGAQSRAFVYSIPISGEGGKRAEGITVVGARQLASVYGGIQATVISTLSKRGGMFISRSFPYGGFPGRLDVQKIPDLEDEEDFYEVMIEVHDLKTGNKIPSSRREYRFEKRSAKSMKDNPQQDPMFERPHLEQIAFSKAFRNGVTALIPQDAVLQFKAKNLALNADVSFVGSLMEEKRSGVLRYAAARAIGVDRDAMETLTFDQIAGLADAAREGSLEGFMQSAQALGIVIGGDEPDRSQRRVVSEPKPQPAEGPKQAANGQQQPNGQQRQQTAARKEAEPKQQDGKPPTGATRPAQTRPAAAKQEEQQAFDHHAFAADGNEALTSDGFALHFSSAVDFANWYRGVYVEKTGEALAGHNADALADAYLDTKARQILEEIDGKETDKTDEPAAQQTVDPNTRQLVPMITLPDGTPNWPEYNKALVNDLTTVTSEPEMNTWMLVNRQNYQSTKLRGARTNFGGRIEAMIEEKMKALRASARDHDMERATKLVGDLEAVQALEELENMGKSGAIRAFVSRMKETRPDITEMLRAANVAAEKRLKAAPAAEQADEAPASSGDGMPDHDPQ